MQTKNIQKFYTDNEDIIYRLSREYNIEISTILAILAVESRDDDGFNPDGSLIIRFEAHKFLKYAKNKQLVQNYFRFDAKKPWTKQVFRNANMDTFEKYHGNQMKEHTVFRYAKQLDEHAAFMSISMGLPQIMGFNHKKIGFNTAEEMYDTFYESTEAQIQGLFDFCGVAMKKYLREERYFEFARLYNGEGQAAKYAQWIVETKNSIEEWLNIPDEIETF